MRFWKMNGAGNDFVILNNLEEHLPLEQLPQIARTLCERHMSIGADGLMVVDAPSQGGDYRMLFYNSDGSVGEMCGNGARCICRYGYENGLAGETQTVETTAGIVTGRRIDQRLYRIRLNDPTTVRLDSPVEADGVTYTPDMVLGPARKGLKVTYTTDTRPTESIVKHAPGSDLFICEGMYGEDDKLEKAKGYKHMTFREAAALARDAGVKEMWLTHYSPSLIRPDEYMDMVRGIFPNAYPGKDGKTMELNFEED